MPRIAIDHGPPAQRGVTTLMSVGGLDPGETPVELAVEGVLVLSALTFGLGWLIGSRTLQVGAVGAFAGAKLMEWHLR
jgi:hypothetical protein